MALETRSDDYSLWFYYPNKGAPIAFALLFLISGLVHGYQCMKYHSFKVTGLLPWSASLFVAGFILRAIGAFGNTENLGIYIASTVLLLAGPPVYEACNFLTLGRILYYIPYQSPIHPGRVFTTFVAIGAVIETITANGAAQLANRSNTPSQKETGESLLKAALILQLAQMVGFVSVALRYWSNCSRAGVLNAKIKRSLVILMTSCTLITIRTVYRTVEYFLSPDVNSTDYTHVSSILTHEWYFYVFEATIMFLNTSMLNIFHPMAQLPRSNKVYLAKDGVTELEGPGYNDKRPFLLTIFDPFDIVGIVTRRNRPTNFWDNPENQSIAVKDGV